MAEPKVFTNDAVGIVGRQHRAKAIEKRLPRAVDRCKPGGEQCKFAELESGIGGRGRRHAFMRDYLGKGNKRRCNLPLPSFGKL